MSQPPLGHVRQWVEAVAGRVVAARRLAGGITSVVHAVRLEDGHELVLKERHDDREGLIPAEAAALGRVRAAGLPAPELVAISPDRRALLLTMLPGAIDLAPRDPDAWLHAIARVAARIHDAAVEAPAFEAWLDPACVSVPTDASIPALWHDAFATVGRAPPVRRATFLHRDLQHFNLLWSGDELSGVVDWAGACHGPPEYDVGHCRLNLAVLYSAERAEGLRELYEAETGRTLDPAWDIHALLDYSDGWRQFIPLQVAGRVPVDVAGMTARVETLLAAAMKRRG